MSSRLQTSLATVTWAIDATGDEDAVVGALGPAAIDVEQVIRWELASEVSLPKVATITSPDRLAKRICARLGPLSGAACGIS